MSCVSFIPHIFFSLAKKNYEKHETKAAPAELELRKFHFTQFFVRQRKKLRKR
jgi:hypothetical protein